MKRIDQYDDDRGKAAALADLMWDCFAFSLGNWIPDAEQKRRNAILSDALTLLLARATAVDPDLVAAVLRAMSETFIRKGWAAKLVINDFRPEPSAQ